MITTSIRTPIEALEWRAADLRNNIKRTRDLLESTALKNEEATADLVELNGYLEETNAAIKLLKDAAEGKA